MTSINHEMLDDLMESARRARRAGDEHTAIGILERALSLAPLHAPSLNMLGLAFIAAGRPNEAAAVLAQAVVIEPSAVPIRLNLADALQGAGDLAAALESLDQALTIDPYSLPSLIRKGQLLERVGQDDQALRAYRAVVRLVEGAGELPPAYADGVARAKHMVEIESAQRLRRVEASMKAHGVSQMSAAGRAYIEQLCGTRKIFVQEPTGPHFPFLPAIEYFDEDLFPWFSALRAAYPVIRDELVALWHTEVPGFDPYVRFDSTTPINQWSELNHSLRWSAHFLWRDGVRQEQNIKRCPKTSAVVETLPLLDVPGKAPTVMFSILAPGTHIPAHSGVTNTRATIHLPLIVPDGCRFRVGGETREWEEGRAWAFDDTIEHEAWNDSDRPRAILIVDAWNPLLSDVDRNIVRLAAPEVRL